MLEVGVLDIFAVSCGVFLLTFGVFLIIYLRRKGGLEFSLAQMIAVPRRRSVFLAGLVLSLSALFGIGFSDGLEALVGVPNPTAAALRTALFGSGVAGMVVLMLNALQARDLSLEAGWSLQETGERLSFAATTPRPESGLGNSVEKKHWWSRP